MRARTRQGDVAGLQDFWRGSMALVPALGLAAVLVVLAQPLVAATITVNRFDSEVNANDGDCTLPEAITAANSDQASGPWLGECDPGSGADTIVLTGHVTLDEVDNNAHFKGSNGLPAIDSEITLEGDGFSITRDATAPDFRFFFLWQEARLTVKNTWLGGGRSEDIGGAVFNFYGRLTLVASTLSGNWAQYHGGAISNFGTVTLLDSTLSDNTAAAPTSVGGGIFNINGGSVSMIDSTVSGNTAGHTGGGVSLQSHGTASLIRTRIERNTAKYGGGIAAYHGSVTVLKCTLSDNSARDSGGGILIGGQASLKLTDSTLSTNNALHGGGAYSTQSAVTVTRSTFSGNAALSGGGIEVESGTVSLSNTTLSHNLAVDGSGGGLNHLGGSTALTHTTIMDSNATQGGAGIHSEAGTVKVTSSIIGDSTGPNCHGTIENGSKNFDDDDSCPWPGVISLVDSNLDDNGGPTLTHALWPGSSALNTTFPCLLVTDQRGGWRDFLCDSGAFELGVDDPYEHSGVGGGDDSCPGHQIQYGHAEHHLLLDQDWVWFDVQVGATYVIETSSLHGAPPANTHLELKRNCTTDITSDDDSGEGNASRITRTATVDDVLAGGLDVRVQEVVAYDTEIGYDLSVTCVLDCPPCTASGFSVFQLFDEIIFTFHLVEACETIWAGRTFVIRDATLVLRAGETVRLDDGFAVFGGGELVVEIDPSLKATP